MSAQIPVSGMKPISGVSQAPMVVNGSQFGSSQQQTLIQQDVSSRQLGALVTAPALMLRSVPLPLLRGWALAMHALSRGCNACFTCESSECLRSREKFIATIDTASKQWPHIG